MCNYCCFSTATAVTRRRLAVALYAQACFFFRVSQEQEISWEILGSQSDAGGERSILGCYINIDSQISNDQGNDGSTRLKTVGSYLPVSTA
jgi:hypothetical protein